MSSLHFIHDRLRALCQGTTPAEIGRLTGTHPECVRAYLRGQTAPAHFLGGLCMGARVSADWLLCGRGRPLIATYEGDPPSWDDDLAAIRTLVKDRCRTDWLDLFAGPCRTARLSDREGGEDPVLRPNPWGPRWRRIGSDNEP